MGDAKPTTEAPRNLIVSSTPSKQQKSHESLGPVAVSSISGEPPPPPQPQAPGKMATAVFHQPFDVHQQPRFIPQPYQLAQTPAVAPQASYPTHHDGYRMPIAQRPTPGFPQQRSTQLQLPRQPLQPRFQTGPSTAAVAYQISQQIQNYQGGVVPSQEQNDQFYGTPVHHQPVYDPYVQHYGFAGQDPSVQSHHGGEFQGTFTPGYTPQYPHPGASPPGSQWYPQQHNTYYLMHPAFAGAHLGAVPFSAGLHHQQASPESDPYRGRSHPARVPRYSERTADVGARDQSAPNDFEDPGAVSQPYRDTSAAEGNVPSTSLVENTARLQETTTPPERALPRGPPRKPKQSGNALWVGNLPVGTSIVDLKDYFSRHTTSEIESVFLISKSNCAFVNYRTESACSSALQYFHDSRFQNTRLVCRLRRTSTPSGSTLQPTTPSRSPSQPTDLADHATEVDPSKGQIVDIASVVGVKSPPAGPGIKTTRIVVPGKDRFFIVKSLTVEDLDLSVKNGIWATQSHNETALNQAFKTADNVYLIFSANKSGEYYGYARMVSAISDDPSNVTEWAPPAQSSIEPELPKAIYTPSTSTAPEGRIIDDSARGTIFWEALNDDEAAQKAGKGKDDPDDTLPANAGSNAWGKPFKVEWLSTSRVPFYRTRGLRNQWNSNREVKIARDGTELEETVGGRLLQMFQRNNLGLVAPIVNERLQESGAVPANNVNAT